MQAQYKLKQTVIVTLKKQKTIKSTSNPVELMGGNTFFFGEIVAINNNTQLCIRRFNSKDSQHTDIAQLQWINLDTDEYTVAEAIL
jgi:hypothetical protein